MHNQRRDEYKARMRDEATAAKLSKKAQQWHALSAELIRRRKKQKALALTLTATSTANATSTNEVEGGEGTSTDTSTMASKNLETIQLTSNLLSVNPDPIYLWNHRRELLLIQLQLDSKTYNHGGYSGGDSVDTNTNTSPPMSSTFIQQEQILTQTALQRNPKAYGAWFHRKWTIRQFIAMTMTIPSVDATEEKQQQQQEEGDPKAAVENCKRILEGELILCSEFLTLDERNFHCWNYRRFVVSTLAIVTLMGGASGSCASADMNMVIDGGWSFLDMDSTNGDPVIGPQLSKATTATTTTTTTTSSPSSFSPSVDDMNTEEEVTKLLQKEWEFSSEKIYQNFSNGSAFHYRSKLLPLLLHYSKSNSELSNKTKSDWIQEELELIRNAIFTEPDDQTSWWYFRFILSWANPMTDKKTDTESCAVNDEDDNEEMEEYKQTLYEEWTSIQELVEAEGGECKWGLLGLFMIATHFCDLEKDGVRGAVEYEGENWLEHAQSYLNSLKELDPDRKHRYESISLELTNSSTMTNG